MKRAIIAAAVALSLAGCAGSGTPEELVSQIMAPEPPAKVTVKTSTFCRQTTKINGEGAPVFALTWDVNDTPETVTGVEAQNVRWKAAKCEQQFKAPKVQLPKPDDVKPLAALK